MQLNHFVHFVTFDIDGSERTGRTEVFARSAADALGDVDRWNLNFAFWAVVINHFDGMGGTMPGTVATGNVIVQHYAVFLYPYRVADLQG